MEEAKKENQENTSFNLPASFKRRQFIILPKFQYKYSLFFGSIALCISALLFASFYYTFSDVYYQLIGFLINEDAQLALSVREEFQNAVFTLAIVQILFTVGISMGGIFLTHKIAGPMWKIMKIMKEIEQTRNLSTRINFRRDDEFKDVADSFNSMMDKIEEKYGEKK
jgi:methyl-accepting chemotaxis protein